MSKKQLHRESAQQEKLIKFRNTELFQTIFSEYKV